MKNKSALVGLVFYLLLVVAGPVLKLAHVGPFAHWGWWRATGLLWGPWVLVAGALVYTILAVLLTKQTKLEPQDEYYEQAVK